MRKCRWALLVVGSLLGIVLVTYFEPTRCVRGWLWGEAFFDGRPSSYWHEVIVQELQNDPRVLCGTLPPPPGPWWGGYTMAIGIQQRDDTSFQLVKSRDADAVLHQLSGQDSCRAARFASDILQGIRPRQPFSEATEEFRAWFALICTHHREPQDFTKLIPHQ